VRVVSDSGPLIHLARAGHFDLLQLLYGRLLIPPSVYQEVVVRGRGQDGSRELSRARWIHHRRPRRADLATALGAFLGRGEAEAIALAAERKDTLLLIDEVHGRRVARKMGISVRGALGVLLQGHRAHHVPDLAGAIARMRERGTWIADEVVAAIMATTRER
jgi:predicted nucleic acid-binding protein